MNIDSTRLVYFSPTRTTKRVVEAIAEGTRYGPIAHLDMTPPKPGAAEFGGRDELAVIGTPVYGGRVPTDAVGRLRRLEGSGTPAVVVVVYGNREYEDALLELRDLAVERGFRPVAGGAFLGEHSYSTEERPIANGRPDAEDIGKAREFGRVIREMLDRVAKLEDMETVRVPGNFPYKDRSKRSGDVAPVTREDLCIKCGTCAEVCPKAAIAVGETVDTDPALCIFCTACVKNCPVDARIWEHPRILRGTEWLHANCGERKEPETYLL